VGNLHVNFTILVYSPPKLLPYFIPFLSSQIFTARRNDRIASAVLATAIRSVCLSVTRRYCVKTTARSTVQFAPSDSKMSVFVETKKIFPRDDHFPLISWLQVTYPLLMAASFDILPCSASTVRDRKRSSITLNKNSTLAFQQAINQGSTPPLTSSKWG